MDRLDAITRDEMLAIFRWNASEHSPGSNSNKASFLVLKHGLTQFPDPSTDNGVLYSRKQCEAVWAKIKPLSQAA